MQRLKLFLSAKKCRFFLAPDEKGVNMMNIIHRAQKMGAIVLDEKSEELPDISTFNITQFLEGIITSDTLETIMKKKVSLALKSIDL